MGAALGDDAPGPHPARMLRVWTRHEGDRQLVILPLQKEQLGPPDPQRLLGSSDNNHPTPKWTVSRGRTLLLALKRG